MLIFPLHFPPLLVYYSTKYISAIARTMSFSAANEKDLGSEVVMLLGGRGQALVRTAGQKGASMFVDVFYRGGVVLWASNNPSTTTPPIHDRDVSSLTAVLEMVLHTTTATTMSHMQIVSSPESSPFPVSDIAVFIASKTAPCAAVGATLGSFRNSLSFNTKKKQMKERGKCNITKTVFLFDHSSSHASNAT